MGNSFGNVGAQVKNYFRVVDRKVAPSKSIVHVFFFNSRQPSSIHRAWDLAKACATTLQSGVVAWRRPELDGPWYEEAKEVYEVANEFQMYQ